MSPALGPALRPKTPLLLLLVGILPLVGCAGTSASAGEPSPYTPPPPTEPEAIGYFLTRMDRDIRAWSNLKLTATSRRDFLRQRALESALAHETRLRKDELIDQLESGPPHNRAVSAVALGFVGDEEVLSPLLSALNDPDEEVVHNALMGLGILGYSDTPLAKISWLMTHHADPFTRNNAAFAIHSVVSAGGGIESETATEALEASCRLALTDTEPGVRAQSASVLGLLVDEQAIDPLGELLFDDVALVMRAAASALSRIGREDAASKGVVARSLVVAFESGPEDGRHHVYTELRKLSRRDYGNEIGEWHAWALKIP